MNDLSGQIIRGYELAQLIDRGGFGVVYRAYQAVVDREVAIKIIRPQYANHPEFIRRFEAEAQLIARLEHPHIVPLYDYWREPDSAYLVMRWLRGGNLDSTLTRGPVALSTVARLLEQIGSALAAAHRKGVVHQDVKPSNILLDEEGNAYLTDFGIAKEVLDDGEETRESFSFGSPPYMSPEAILHEPITPRSDIYSLGIVLFELLTGKVPFLEPSNTAIMRRHVHDPVPALQLSRPDLPQDLNLVIWRATAKSPEARYPDALSMAEDFRHAAGLAGGPPGRPVIRAAAVPGRPVLKQPDTVVLEPLVEPENPYKGLRAFEEADAADFFGREKLVAALLQRLTEPGADARFLALVGPSGSGKSSLVNAGLLPALRQGRVSGSRGWFAVRMLPGARPFVELREALLRVASDAGQVALEQLQADEHGLRRVVRQALPGHDAALLLFIDQFEELFTTVQSEAERALFLNSLRAAVTDPDSPLRVVIALRADFYDRPLLYPGFGELMRAQTEVVLPLSSDELVRAIVEPAERIGMVVEKDLVATIVSDVNEQPGALPLLQYALTELFEYREANALTLKAYQATGGVLGALARRADELYDQLDPRGQQAARQLFLRLVALGEGAEDTRRRVHWAELTSLVEGGREAMQVVLDRFGRYRLLTFDHDPQTRAPTVEVAHEALIRQWGRLRAWLDESREDLLVQRRLAAATSEWIRAGREPSYLATGARLLQFEALAKRGALSLSGEEVAYLEESVHLRQRLARRNRLFIVALVIFSLLAMGAALFAFDRQAQALAERDRADLQARISRSRELAVTALTNMQALDRSLLLSLEALDAADTFEAHNSLFTALGTYPRLRAYLHGSDRVRAVAYSPDGRLLAVADQSGAITLWDAASRRRVGASLVGHSGPVNALAFSPDGQILASAGADGAVRLWTLADMGEIGSEELAGHADDVWGVAFSPDGRTLASGAADDTIRLWDVETRQPIGQPLAGHTSYVTSLAFSPDGRLLASGSDDATVRLWDGASGEPVGEPLEGHANTVWSVAFSPDGRTLASGSFDGTIRLWDVAGGQPPGPPLEGHEGWVRGVAFSPDGQTLASASDDSTVRLWDVSTREAVGEPLVGHGGPVWDVAFSPDGQTLASGGSDGDVLLWSASVPHRLGQRLLAEPGPVNRVAFSPDGSLLAVAGGQLSGSSEDNFLHLWDMGDGTRVAAWEAPGRQMTAAAFSPDGRKLVSARADGMLLLWNVAAAGEAWEPAGVLAGPGPAVYDVAFSPDGRTLAVASEDGSVTLWDMTVPQQVGEPWLGHSDAVLSVAFSPDGRLLASGGRDTAIILWEVATGRTVGEPLTGHPDAVHDLAFSPDGRLLASAGRGSGTTDVFVWDVAGGRLLRRLAGHQNWVNGVSFSPDGRYLASGGADGAVMLWDVQRWRPLGRPLIAYGSEVWSVTFSPDGLALASGGRDGTVALWDMSVESWQQRACRIANRNLSSEEWERYLGALPYRETCPAGPGL